MARWLQIRLLTWDVKDILVRFRRSVGEEYVIKVRVYGLEVEVAVLGEVFGQAYKVQSYSFFNYGLSYGFIFRRWWLGVVLQIFYFVGVRDVQVVVFIVEQLYEDFSSFGIWQVLEGVEVILRGCRKRGLRLVVVFNFDRRLEDILVGFGLREYFDFVLIFEVVGWFKSDFRIFYEVLRFVQVESAVVVYVGDSYYCDYKGVRVIGMYSFLVVGSGYLEFAVKDFVF